VNTNLGGVTQGGRQLYEALSNKSSWAGKCLAVFAKNLKKFLKTHNSALLITKITVSSFHKQ
jgi:hypothetical protein